MTAEPDAPDEAFRAMLLSGEYPCLGGSAAVRRGHYACATYPALGSTPAIDRCAADLAAFLADRPEATHPVAVYVAVFATDGPPSEVDFERRLWQQLAGLRRLDTGSVTGRADLAGDPGFVFAGRNLFVVGLHPGASRQARRFGWRTLVFNALSHADPLLAAGKYQDMTEQIRRRDVRLQGSLNPSTFQPRVAQFSGRAVDADWRCPVQLDLGGSA